MNFWSNNLAVIIMGTVVAAVLAIVYFGVKWYFEVQMVKAKSNSGVALMALSLLGLAYLGTTNIWNQLLQLLVDTLNAKYPDLNVQPPSNLWNYATFSTFMVGMVLICGLYYAQYIKRKREEIEREESQITKNIISPPPVVPPEPVAFHERIEGILMLKYKKYAPEWKELKYGDANRVFYLHYKDDLKTYIRLVFCWNDIDKTISREEQEQAYQYLDGILNQLTPQYPNNAAHFYLITNGQIEKKADGSPFHEALLCQTEDDLLNNLIDFRPYLKELVRKFKTDKLPFSNIDKEEDKRTNSFKYGRKSMRLLSKSSSVWHKRAS